MTPSNTTLLVKQEFDSFEEFAELAVSWNVDFHQLDSEQFKSVMFQAQIGTLLVSSARLGCHVEQHGATPPGMYTFAIPDKGSSDMRWFGNTVGVDVLLSFPTHGEIDVFSRPGLSVLTFSISQEVLEIFLERNHAHDLITSAGITETIFFSSAEQIDELRYLLKLAPIIVQLGNKNHAISSDYQEHVLSALLQVLDQEKPRQRIDPSRGQHALDHVIEYVQANPDSPIRITDLCALSGVAERTLRYLFRKGLGLSPKSFLVGRRLYGVHRELWHSASSTTRVADLANKWGFWHMGQFAADYRKLFGELPSETLGRTP